MPAELAAQRPLLERAATGDREAFGQLYDTQVEGVYRYLLAWTADRLEAAELTTQVFHSAIGWLPSTPGPEGEAAAWLTAMSRDALTHRMPVGPAGPEGDVIGAVARLSDPQREVVVLRLLLGHSLDHTAHLSGYSRRAAMELQLAACLAVRELTTGRRAGATSPQTQAAPSAEEFERWVGREEAVAWKVGRDAAGPAGGDPMLAGALAVAGSLRRAAPRHVVTPAIEFVRRLRADLVAGSPPATGPPPAPWSPLASSTPGTPVDSREHHPLRSATVPLRGPQQPEVAGSAGRRPGGRRPGGGWVGGLLARRPWWATGVATAGIVVVLGFQAFGGSGAPPECARRPCPASTTVAAVAGGGSSLGTPLTTVREPSTTTSTVADDAAVVPSTAPPRTSAATVPPTTRPATTAPPTTAPRPTTTTAPTTTAPPTTAPTTTTVAPTPPT